MSKCPGKTPTGKACRRKVVPGATLCEHHHKENLRKQAEAQIELNWAKHCETLCNHQSRNCKRPRHGDNELCKQCLDAQKEQEEAAAAALKQQKQVAEEDANFYTAIEDAEWWPGYERWLKDKIRQVIDEEAYRFEHAPPDLW
jgi:hypothetical protein